MQNHSDFYSILTDTPSVEDEAEESESESCAAPLSKHRDFQDRLYYFKHV